MTAMGMELGTSMATEDDEIEIVSVIGQSTEVSCEICYVSLATKPIHERQLHYEEHFKQASDKPEKDASVIIDLSSSGGSHRGSPSSITTKKAAKEEVKTVAPPSVKQNIFWYQSKDFPPPSNFSPSLVPVLKQALSTSHSKGRTVRAALCYSGVVHVSTEWWDSVWGCGYRNFLMACTALMDQQIQPLYFPALDEPSPPGVRNLQQWIEDAWHRGYDPEGAADLNSKLVGTRKWIGTAELHVAFLSRGIPSYLVDFPQVDTDATAVLNWIVSYFSESSREAGDIRLRSKVKATVDEALRGASPVVMTDRMPLVLQHKGHSRTIIGYERTKDGSINLLCFDPAQRPPSSVRKTALRRFNASRPRQDCSVGTSNPPTRYRSISPSKVIRNVFHPKLCKGKGMDRGIDAIGKKRGIDQNARRDSKRPKGGLRAPDDGVAVEGVIEEAIEISDNDEVVETNPTPRPSPPSKSSFKPAAPELDYTEVLNFFRLRPKKVGKNDRYQILYFPLEDILTDDERWRRRIVTSEVIP